MHTFHSLPTSLRQALAARKSPLIHSFFRQRHQTCKSLLLAAALMAGLGSARAHAYVNVTVGGEFAPGVYGQIAVGNNPPPPVIYAQPVVVGTPLYGAPVVYMHVPAHEYRDWSRYCGKYRVCAYPVQFVRVDAGESWWQQPSVHGPDRVHPRSEGRQDWRHGHRGHGGEEYHYDNRDH